MIFTLPPQFSKYDHPLAYVEWFTPLGQPDPGTGMRPIRRSTRQLRRNASILSVDRISRGCHLIAKVGSQISAEWNSDNVLEMAQSFYVNHYVDDDSFLLLQS